MNYSTRQNGSSEGLHFIDNLVLSVRSIMKIGLCKEFLKLRFKHQPLVRANLWGCQCVFQGRNTDHLQWSDVSCVSQNFGTEESRQSQWEKWKLVKCVCWCLSSHITHFYNQKSCVQLHVGTMAVKCLTFYLKANLDMVALLWTNLFWSSRFKYRFLLVGFTWHVWCYQSVCLS